MTSAIANSRRLAFTGKQQVKLEPFDLEPCSKDEVLVQTHFSLMSTGTENIVFNRNFDAGSHWDNWVKYPFYPGYASVGVVLAVGPGVTSFQVGQRVAYRSSHRSHALVNVANLYPIPEGLAFEDAAWFSLAKIAFMGAKAAAYHLGDSVLIIGAGPIGQMSLRWANAAGAGSIVVVDTAASRMPLATAGGATALVTAPIHEAREAVLKAGHGKLPRVVIDSTGNAAVFSAALGLAADRGKVVILGDTGQPTSQSLTSDVIGRGLTIVGAHDAHNTAEWNDATITQLFFDFAASGRFSLAGLNRHVFKPEQCEDAYAAANRDRSSTMGIVFDWTNGEGAAQMSALRQSFSWWCFKDRGVEAEALLAGAAKIGYHGVDLIDEELWPVAQRHGLHITAVNAHSTFGLNRRENAAAIEKEVQASLKSAEKWKIPVLICFTGNRNGQKDEAGLEICAETLKRLAPMAESAGVKLAIELFNSKVDHPDYQGDSTAFGVRLCEAVNSPAVRLLYDIYHMQIMEGDVIRTIQNNNKWFAHYHTAGNPGRSQPDETQELYYPAIYRAIIDTKYGGIVAHEFVPKGDPLKAIEKAFQQCAAA